MYVSFQDHETSFPRALSAQRLSPRWCFLDGECFCISWRGGDWGSHKGKVLMDRVDSNFPKDYSETLHVALHVIAICISNDVNLLMSQHTFLKLSPSKQVG